MSQLFTSHEKYWSFSISPSNEYTGLISLKTDWSDLAFPESGTFPMSQLFVRLPKYWSFSFNISPSNEYSGLISLKIDWFDLHAVQGTFRRPSPQFESMTSLVLCLFYSLALKTVNDHWEDHSLGYTDLCQGSNISAFQHTV